jgi:hypothetical protein
MMRSDDGQGSRCTEAGNLSNGGDSAAKDDSQVPSGRPTAVTPEVARCRDIYLAQLEALKAATAPGGDLLAIRPILDSMERAVLDLIVAGAVAKQVLATAQLGILLYGEVKWRAHSLCRQSRREDLADDVTQEATVRLWCTVADRNRTLVCVDWVTGQPSFRAFRALTQTYVKNEFLRLAGGRGPRPTGRARPDDESDLLSSVRSPTLPPEEELEVNRAIDTAAGEWRMVVRGTMTARTFLLRNVPDLYRTASYRLMREVNKQLRAARGEEGASGA